MPQGKLRQDNAEAQIVVAIAGAAVDPVSNATVRGGAAPTTAANHAVRARTVVKILTPFPNIAAHIVNAKFVGRFRADRMCTTAAVTFVPRYIVNAAATAVFATAGAKFVCRATACRKFPFGFGGKAIIPAGGSVQFGEELLTVVPTYHFHRQIIPFKITRVAAHNGAPLSLRYFVLADVETFGSSDAAA